jgi:hypothetical protein
MVMKINKFRMMLAGMVAFAAVSAQAQDFGGRNGGDPMELQFREVAMDIQQWIAKGGAQALTLPAIVTLESYQSQMTTALNEGVVNFTTNTITVNGVEKVCMNQPELKLIQCNVDRFKVTTESEKYVLVHHEYAGLAGLETNTGAKSDYSISEQLTASLEKVTVLKLAVKSLVSNGSYRDQFVSASPLTMQEFLNIKDPVNPKKDYGSWKCTAENGIQFNMFYVMNEYTDYLTGESYRIENNQRTKTLTASSYTNHSAYVQIELRNYLFIKKLNNQTIIVENAYLTEWRTKRKNPNPSESVTIPNRRAQFSICTQGGKI